MSYEGYTIGLCAAGHRTIKDAYETWEEVPCPYCDTPIVLSHEVDDTNCDGHEREPKLVCTDNTRQPHCYRPENLKGWWAR